MRYKNTGEGFIPKPPKRRKFEPNDPHAEGWDAAERNALRAANPYPPQSDSARRWGEGYSEFLETEGQFSD